MRPSPDDVIRALQTGVATHLAPELKSSYAQAQFAFSMLLFTIVQRDYDTAVPDLIEGNAALRAILGEATAALKTIDRDDARAAAVTLAALPERAAGLRLSVLRAEHDGLRAAVSTLAPVIEPAGDDDGLAALRPMRERLYAWLSADAKRRSVPILSA
jgi:hypothetical protein